MGMVVQHNISAMNANEAMRKNVAGLKKQTEKLSTGYNINRAADNAAGLAISEKMRSQIRGLTQASANANDAISLIQTAEGGLQETEDIMQRMRELSVQSANGTYTDEDRQQIQYEVDALKSEVDRIAQSTEFNEMKLLDGSLAGAGGNNGEYGPKYGVVEDTLADLKGAAITSNIKGVKITTTANASGDGGENAIWKAGGKELTLNLVTGKTYTQKDIDDLIANATVNKDAGQTGNPAEVSIKLKNGIMTMNTAGSTKETAAGERAVYEADLSSLVADGTNGGMGSGDKITFTANTYGSEATTTGVANEIKVFTDVAAGKEELKVGTARTATAGEKLELHLATGVSYTEDDIKQIFAKAGFDYDVNIEDQKSPGGDDNSIYFNVKEAAGKTATATDGTGVGKDVSVSSGKGLTFQIGANGVEDQRLTVNVDDMGSAALGISGVSVAKQDDANTAINKIDDAIQKVSTQRAKLGAVQNRLEHTVNSLNTANENLTASESQIRDTDMAAEMIKYTKSNILQQASQSMLAQANQQPQGVLQLLG